MATLSALYVATDEPEPVIEALRSRLAGADGGVVESGRFENDAAFYDGDDYFEGLAPQPRAFAVGVQQPGWATAHVGAFEGIGELADALSEQLGVRVVVGQGQTTSEAWRVSVHEEGRTRRHLEFADGDWVVQQGTPFAFESQPLGTNIAEPGEEPCYDFGFDEASAYCTELGFQFWSDRQPEAGWLWLRGGPQAAQPDPAGPEGVAAGGARPWWRRMLGL
jgi:hypothetical protein